MDRLRLILRSRRSSIGLIGPALPADVEDEEEERFDPGEEGAWVFGESGTREEDPLEAERIRRREDRVHALEALTLAIDLHHRFLRDRHASEIDVDARERLPVLPC